MTLDQGHAHAGRTFGTATPDWTPRHPAGTGKPNVIVMIADDLGYSDLGCYGSEIETPALDRLAEEGIALDNFQVTPSCSPTRAALLTGLAPHTVGFGCVAQSDRGFPGYRSALPNDVTTLPEVLRGQGYTTMHVGKWHLTPRDEMTESSPKDTWPLAHGFDHYYGFLEGATNYHHPHRMYRDNSPIEVERYPDGYYVTDDLAEEAVRMVRSAKTAEPDRPFFLYFAHAGVHAPLQSREEDRLRYEGRYDAGWDEIRRERLARQKEIGIFDAGAQVPEVELENYYDFPHWDALTADEKDCAARYMEVYAGMVTAVDRSLERLRVALQEIGEWENTIVVFTSDNGASKEGGARGTTQYLRGLQIWLNREANIVHDHARLGEIGGPRVLSHYPRGWAAASNTPYRLYKLTTYSGGRRAPFVLRLPGGSVSGRRSQFTSVEDLMPTLLDLCGVEHDPSAYRDSRRVPTGHSFVEVLHSAQASPTRREQFWEATGQRGFYRDGWVALTLRQPGSEFGLEEWRLYDTTADPLESNDLADAEPERLAELVAAWLTEAEGSDVFPLDEGTGNRERLVPPRETAMSRPTIVYEGTPTLERVRSAVLIQGRSFALDITFHGDTDDAGVLVSHGSQGGGYIVFVERGLIRLGYNAYGVETEYTLAQVGAGRQVLTLRFDQRADAPTWNVTGELDGLACAEVAGLEMLSGWAPMEGIDIGIDRRSPVLWRLDEQYGSFRYSGRVLSAAYLPGEVTGQSAPSEESEEVFE